MKKKFADFFTRYEFVIPVLIFLFFMAVSLPGIQWGVPELWNPDELVWRAASALRGELVFDETEPDFNYPSLPKYVMYGIGLITYGMGRSDVAFIVAARAFSALLGALAGVLVYYLARLIGANKRIAALAGLLYIVSGVAAANGRFSHNDLYLQFFTILSVYFVVKYQYTGMARWLYVSFFAVGLAASSKYTGGSLILLPILAFIISNWAEVRTRWLSMIGRLFMGGLVSYFGYGVGTPKSLLAPVSYFSSVIPALQNYPQYGFNSGSRIGLFGQWPIFENAVGLFAYYVFILAFLWYAIHWLIWRMKKSPLENGRMQGVGILLLTVLIFDLPFMISINYIERYFIPFVPFLAILGAFFIEEVDALANSRGWNFVRPMVVVVLMLGVTYSTLRLVSISLLFLNDSRIPASEHIATIRGYGKSIEFTLYPPAVEKRRFFRAHNYPIYFVKYPNDVVPTGGRYEYNLGEQGLLDRNTDYFVIDSYTYSRFYTDSVCVTNQVECDFFKQLLAGENENFRLMEKFAYQLPPYLPYVTISAVNPDILIFERIR